jgi:omega-6 fatty acid desaturase (delta-12 desaturase)
MVKPPKPVPAWRRIVARYQVPDRRRAVWQMVNTFLPYMGLWVLMVLSLNVSYLLTLGLAILAGGFLARIFIIFHDCGHRSFFKTPWKNDTLGFLTGVLSLTPYHYWRYHHAIHHATTGNLDRRGIGDIWTMTVQEYCDASRWERFKFRLYRSPLILFVVGPLLVFFVKHRFARIREPWRWHRSVLWTNLAIVALAVTISAVIGWKAYLLIQVPVMAVAAIGGVWLFYVQHQFEGVYWERNDKVDPYKAAMQGSSFYRLPRVLQWFTGNIGFHHIHHLSPRIPNYMLDKCHQENATLQNVKTLSLWSSFKTIRYRLWDEEKRKLVGIGFAWL